MQTLASDTPRLTALSTPRGESLAAWHWLTPLCGALCYPLFLRSAYGGMQSLASARTAGERFASILVTVAGLAAAFAVPLIAALSARRIARTFEVSGTQIRAYRLAHVVFAAPPLFTATGVITDVLGIGPFDYLVWLVLWLAVGLYLWVSAPPNLTDEARAPRARAAAVHGSIALAVLLVFLIAHLWNHATALWSTALHQRTMKMLEHLYRARVVEPLLVLGMLLLVVTGLRLAWRHTARRSDGYRCLQTLTGFYLAAFILSHLTAILVLARWQRHVDTGNWVYESAAPDGFLRNVWNTRLLPHYSLAVWAVLTHVGLGLRGVLRAHGAADRTANLTARLLSIAGGAASIAISAALLGVHLIAP